MSIPYFFASAHKVCLSEVHTDYALVATTHTVLPTLVLSEIIRKIQLPVKITSISKQNFDFLLAKVYSSGDAATVADDIQDGIAIADLMHDLQTTQDLLESSDDAPVIKLINAFLSQACKDDASDIHLDPYQHKSLVRFRKDGVLQQIVDIHSGLHAALVSRIKIMAHLDIAEKRLPQDGRISLRLAGRELDLRISTMPTGHGERVVMRLLDKNKDRLQLETLGMAADTLQNIDHLIKQPHGILLVTGPTGSGKSTTLSAALARLDSSALNIMTVEDPIEYDIAGISQTQVNAKISMTFAKALRAILRQDPDVVMIGEIRDIETAQIAVQASLTGHLVLATLHTNSAISAITRLLNMGVESFLLSSTIIGVLAQRLIRLLCQSCKTKNILLLDDLRIKLGIPLDVAVYKAVGCDICNHTGYKGRSGIHELLLLDAGLQELVHSAASETAIEVYANQKLQMRTLRADALRWVLAGKTSLEEVIAVTKDN